MDWCWRWLVRLWVSIKGHAYWWALGLVFLGLLDTAKAMWTHLRWWELVPGLLVFLSGWLVAIASDIRNRQLRNSSVPAPESQKAADEPNFECVDGVSKHIYVEKLTGIRTARKEDERVCVRSALTLRFRNAARDRKVSRADRVSGQIEFHSLDWKVPHTITHGAWLDARYNTVRMAPGDMQELLLCFEYDDGTIATLEDKRGIPATFSRPFEWLEEHRIAGSDGATVTLFDGVTQARRTFEFKISKDNSGFKVTPTENGRLAAHS